MQVGLLDKVSGLSLPDRQVKIRPGTGLLRCEREKKDHMAQRLEPRLK